MKATLNHIYLQATEVKTAPSLGLKGSFVAAVSQNTMLKCWCVLLNMDVEHHVDGCCLDCFSMSQCFVLTTFFLVILYF